MNIFTELEKLNLPSGEYSVIGSGILGALGIREIHDIDLIITSRLFDELQSEGWIYDEVEIEGRMRKRLQKGSIEAYKDFWYLNKDLDINKMIVDAVIVKGFPFMSLEELLKFKYSLDRPKDHKDIALIKKYIG